MAPDLVVVSNRGPLSFSRDNAGKLVAGRGAGGLVSILGPAIAGRGATWIASAITDEDREAAAGGDVEAEGFRLRQLVPDDADYRMYYDVIANGTLWFMHHGLYDLPRRPLLNRYWHEAWEGYRRVNHAFAEMVADEAGEGATVLVQDYHLSLLGAELQRLRPDLRAVHFHHTPFCGPTSMRTLPTPIALELLEGLAGFRSCGFHSPRWAAAFEACCRDVLGNAPATFIAPAAADHVDIEKVAASEDCQRELVALDELVGDKRLIVRVDRIELSKNLLRGFSAYDELLRARPDLVGNVVFAALVYPSREQLPEYLAYRQEVESMAQRLNDEWGTDDWQPIYLDTSDFFPRSVAALRRYDVLLVNPVRDGLNLVAKEGAMLNERDGVLALSREAGAWEELQGAALEVNPFDVTGTAEVLATALDMDAGERADRATRLRDAATATTPASWLDAQLAAAR
ncbi:MAG: trehalose-6-phosphate synthase [Actinobacteria bacterium]|nr:trehalose-6-phosphate synthase [Actinomycetota bacterium]MBV9254818.1 trehalose-6-phosphate synthase [Actinomycetota bacterium]